MNQPKPRDGHCRKLKMKINSTNFRKRPGREDHDQYRKPQLQDKLTGRKQYIVKHGKDGAREFRPHLQ